MMPSATVFLAKRSLGVALVAVLAGCATPQVRPTAGEVALMVIAEEGRAEPVLEVLADRRFFALTGSYNGPRHEAPTGQCVEKYRGNAIYGYDVVRLCHDGQGAVEGVFARPVQTRRWVEVRSEP